MLEKFRATGSQIGTIIVGKTLQIRQSLTCLLAGGHLLIEDAPGVGKTTLAHAIALSMGLPFRRIQFTSDLLPSDVIGVSVYDRTTGQFVFHPGPIFTEVLLADEINRASPKTQSALLEAMEENQVSTDGLSRPLPQPFFVIATQNPLHQVGTFPLPESQLDRFLMCISLGYPDRAAERSLLAGEARRDMLKGLQPVARPADLLAAQAEVKKVYVSSALLDYIQALIAHTRASGKYAEGLSPRGGIALLAAARTAAATYGSRSDVQQFIDEMVEQHGFERTRVERWLNSARYSETVERLMQPPIPFGQRNWLEYRARYLEDKRIEAGAAFWRANATSLARATERFGVPAEIVVAIIGVETYWGRITGNFRTIDVLATLTFDYLRRAEYYRRELIDLLLLAREQRVDPLSFKGSFAGAIGLPQFMPGSVRRYAVDFDSDGRIDLAGSAADAIGSVANFLSQHGWQRDLPILFEAEADEDIVDTLGRGIQAAATWSDALNAGVVGDVPLSLDTPVIVIDLPYVDASGETKRLYRVGTANFSAVLNYNRSYFYATAVVELAQALRREVAPS